MNKVVTAHIENIALESRFEPKLYIFKETLQRAQNKYTFVPLHTISDKVARGQSPKPSAYKDKWNATHNFIRTVDVKKHQTATETTVYLDDTTYDSMKSNRVSGGDILVSVVGNYLGSAAVVPFAIDEGLFNDNSARICLTDTSISPFYLAAFLNSKFGQQLIHSKATRTGQKILSAGNLKSLEIPLISNEDISSLLKTASKKEDEANYLIFSAQKLCRDEIAKELKDLCHDKSFSVNLSSFKDVDLWTPKYSFPLYIETNARLKKKYGSVKIRQIANLIKGDEIGSDSYIPYIDRTDTDVAFIRTTDVVNYDLDLYPDFFTPYETYSELNQGFNSGDILFTKDGKIGVVAMVVPSDKVVIGSGFAGIRVTDRASDFGVSPEYLFLLLSIKEVGLFESRRRSVHASTIPHLREERLLDMEIPILPEEIMTKVTLLVKKAFLLKEEKKAMIQEASKKMDALFSLV